MPNVPALAVMLGGIKMTYEEDKKQYIWFLRHRAEQHLKTNPNLAKKELHEAELLEVN